MKTFFITIALILLFAYSSGLKITITPFSIKMSEPFTFFGIIFLALGLGFLNYQTKKDSHFLGYKKGAEDLRKEIVKDIQNDSINAVEYLNREK